MALGMVKRWSFVPLMAGVALFQGCSSSAADDGDSGGCSKDTDCATGRVCEKKVCVDRSGSGAPGVGTACVTTDPILCPSQNDMLLCVDGSYDAYTCPEACEGILYLATGPCLGEDGCECGDPLNAQCDLGVSAFCACSASGCASGSDLDPLGIYIDCASGSLAAEDQTFLNCLGQQIMSDMIDCSAASTACTM